MFKVGVKHFFSNSVEDSHFGCKNNRARMNDSGFEINQQGIYLWPVTLDLQSTLIIIDQWCHYRFMHLVPAAVVPIWIIPPDSNVISSATEHCK